MSYNPVTKEIVRALENIVGKDYVNDSLPMRYAYVSKGIMGLESLPAEVIVRPKDVEEVRQVLMLANENKIPVTPVAGGLSGGFASPITTPSGILLDTSRMDRILEVDTDCRYMVVEPGVRSGTVWAYFRKKYPEWAPPVPD
ncbi:MAG: FAD-binding oxidoreductase, partial [Candidatus Jordarchaeaceae archaeon]